MIDFLQTDVPFEAETWGTPIEREPEYEPEIPPDLVGNDLCPMGCGYRTEDPYGGPCSRCWEMSE